MATKFEKAFLDTIAWAEGTLGVSNNGYDVLVNDNARLGTRIVVGWTPTTDIVHGLDTWKVTVGKVKSTAGGRYQFIGSTWIELNNGNNAPFNKDNQDTACIKLARRKLGGNFDFRITSVNDMANVAAKISTTWSSFVPSVTSATELYEIYTIALGKY